MIYEKLNWTHPTIFIQLIDPLDTIENLLYGKTTPLILLMDKKTKDLFVPCPHCGAIHSKSKWGTQTMKAEANWFGYYCSSCNKVIPVRHNIFSFLILILTFPLWGPFKNILKQRWLKQQSVRFCKSSINKTKQSLPLTFWLATSLKIALQLFIISIILSFFISTTPLSLNTVIPRLLISLLLGESVSLCLMLFLTKRNKINRHIR